LLPGGPPPAENQRPAARSQSAGGGLFAQGGFGGDYAAEAERLHKSIVQPLLSPSSEHYRALQRTHEALLKTVKDVTGKDSPFIQWFGTGPVRPPQAG